MKNILKKIVMALLSAILFISNISVFALESSWKNGIICPIDGELVAAGPIDVKWEPIDEVDYYEIYFDGSYIGEVDNDTYQYQLYSTEVKAHDLYIRAVLDNGEYVETDLVQFYISKKGLAYSDPDNVSNVGASWYYNWGIDSNINSTLEFVPMIWGNGQEVANINTIVNNGYDTVLGYNEPEGTLSGQSNVDVQKAIDNFYSFQESGLRIGSSAVEHIGTLLEEDSWFDQYIHGIDIDDLDFIAVHEYFYSVCTCSDEDNAKDVAKDFLEKVAQVYEKYNKPIWITEIGVANSDSYWPHYSFTSEQGKKEVYEFLNYIINGVDGVLGLNDLDYVERYAWFPFDTTSTTAGASSLFVTESDLDSSSAILGQLNDLGRLYRDSGNPEGYVIINDLTYCDISVNNVKYDGYEQEPAVSVCFEGKDLEENIDYVVTYSQNTDVGNAIAIVKGIGNYTGEKEISFKITAKDIGTLDYSHIESQSYTGEAIEPLVVVKNGDIELIVNKDYKIYYDSNVEIGTGQIKIIGQGNYKGTVRLNFEIVEKDIDNLDYDSIESQVYTGEAIEPPLVIHDGDKELVLNKDYELYYENNIDVGTAIIKVEGIGNYTGTLRLNFEILENPITSLSLNKNSLSLIKGKTYTLKTTIHPTNTSDSKKLTWKSSNTKIATVSSQGVIKAINNGKATITVTTSNGKKATCQVVVPYTVKYVLNGGKNNTSNPSTYYGKKITLKNPTRKGYTFVGWYTSSSYKTKITSFSSGNKTLYAKWKKVSVAKAKTPSLSNIKGKKLKITYKATSGAKGYVIQIATNKKFTSQLKQYTTTAKSKTYTLTKGKTYYVRVRAYKYDSVGNKVYGSWSSVKYKKITK